MHGGCDRGRDGDVMRRGEGEGGGEGEVVVDQETATHVTQLRIIFHERGLAFLLQHRIVVCLDLPRDQITTQSSLPARIFSCEIFVRGLRRMLAHEKTSDRYRPN